MKGSIYNFSNFILGKEDKALIGNVFFEYYFFDYSKPLVVTFSNAGEVTLKENLNDPNYHPWGFNFIKSRDVNVISFSSYEKANWYRCVEFLDFIVKHKDFFKKFSIRLGYGGSMGGFAIGAFADVFEFTRVLLINPISSLNHDATPWESRFIEGKKEDWSMPFSDLGDYELEGYIVYDPIYRLDRLHAKRYGNRVKHLKIPGVGHGMPGHMNRLGLLKTVVDEFIFSEINEVNFYKLARGRRKLESYYKCILSNRNLNLTPLREKTVLRHRDINLA